MPRIDEVESKLTCPTCGGANECRFGSKEPCWCSGRPVSKEALETAMGEFSLDKTCLCRNCLRQFETPDESEIRKESS